MYQHRQRLCFYRHAELTQTEFLITIKLTNAAFLYRWKGHQYAGRGHWTRATLLVQRGHLQPQRALADCAHNHLGVPPAEANRR
jgi:hypothetical protein